MVKKCLTVLVIAFFLWLFSAPAFAETDADSIQIRMPDGVLRLDGGECTIKDVVSAANLVDRKRLHGGKFYAGDNEFVLCWKVDDKNENVLLVDENGHEGSISLGNLQSDKPGN